MFPSVAYRLTDKGRQALDRAFQDEILPIAGRASGRFALIVAREGADYYAWRAGWFRRLEAEIAGELS